MEMVGVILSILYLLSKYVSLLEYLQTEVVKVRAVKKMGRYSYPYVHKPKPE